MRGKAEFFPVFPHDSGITPAYAGKSGTPYNPPEEVRDHPRVCGEKCSDHLPRLVPKGSPPRMRGKGLYTQILLPQSGITPAYAGKSRDRTNLTAAPWDHPRVCGEKGICTKCIQQQQGSPPRMRGKVRPHEKQRNRNGITPAYAGKSTIQRRNAYHG